MRKNRFTLIKVSIIVIIFGILGILVAFVLPRLIKPEPEKEVAAIEKSYDWDFGYPFPPAEEFGESDYYSMVWIGEWGWTWKRFLLVRAKVVHRDYGHLPYLLQAIRMVEKKYIIVSKKFLSTDPRLTDSGLIDSLLLEIRPPENTEEKAFRKNLSWLLNQ